MFVTGLLLALFLPSGHVEAAPSARQALRCVTSSFTNVVALPGVVVTIEKVTSISEGGSYQESGNLGFPQKIDKLPALCAVTVRVTNTSDVPSKPQSSYRFGLFLPTKYNSRIFTVGGSAFAGGINWPSMSEGTHYGFAAISTDNGHNSEGGDLSWATPARLWDWGYRALHGSVVAGRVLIEHYYGKPIQRSYYAGCSTGGRQGLREIQYDANQFDGALIGAPAWDTVHLMPWISKMAVYQLNTTNGRLGTTQMATLAAEVVRQCDPQDGITDNIVSQPSTCNFNINTIVCNNPSTCLTPAQAQTAMKIYSDYLLPPSNRLISNGFTLSSEDQWYVYYGDDNTLTNFDFAFERYFLYNMSSTPFRWQNYTDAVAVDSERINPGAATANKFNLTPFLNRVTKLRGPKGTIREVAKAPGKIIMYHGLADGVLSPKSSQLYYNSTISAMGTSLSEIRSWFRYFEIPGMQHCMFSNRQNAPWDIAAPGQPSWLRMLPSLGVGLPAVGDGWSIPGHLNDSNYDILAALVRWVEEDKPVDKVIATAFNADFSVYRTRPICPWPERAIYSGSGNINNASTWRCQ
ncbi:Tannase/feruloyl esterase [Naviculisporaceae sp. PSN 640]